MIIGQTYDLLVSRYKEKIENLIISDVRIGLYLTAVRLSDGSVGSAATLTDNLPHCGKSDRDFGEFTPMKIKGRNVIDLFKTGKTTNSVLTLKIAVLNAISSEIILSGGYRIIEDRDPVDLIKPHSSMTVTIVGAFHSYIRKISEAGNRLFVLELNEDALVPEHKKFYVPAAEYNLVLRKSDVVIITGLTLVNNTIDNLLDSVVRGTHVIVSGPSSSILPDVLFANKVSIIGATRIIKPDILFDLVSQGGAGYHLFEYCAQKICILPYYESQVK